MQWPQWLGLWNVLVSYSSHSLAPNTLGFQQSTRSLQQPGCRQQITRGRSGLMIAVTVAVKWPRGSHFVGLGVIIGGQ